ncbi:protein eiger isoform X2 [Bradysia coprophila]|uniref:protein eiger isoform X2 n=1 Tax=Bradysia coprophila TaxID=38358 RepID=UPI00187DB045|nr:protein eiger isoform X2 [Bradysia coprophila]
MTAESLKSFISLPSHGSQCSNKRYANGNKMRLTIFAVFMVLFCCAILGLEIWNTIRTTQLAQEVDQLRNALDEMKHRIGFDAMEDLEDFENSYDHTAVMPEPNEEGSFGAFDETDDEEFYEDDDLEGSSDFDPDDYEIDENNMYDDNAGKRNVRSTSIHGVPIVEESYALKRNRTNPRVDDEISRLLLGKKRPALRHDWNDGRTPSAHNLPAYHHNSFPKKYQQHRSPPTEYVQSPYRNHASRTSNEHNSHQYANQRTNQQDDVATSSYGVGVRSGRAMPTNEDKSKAFRRTVKKSEFAKLMRKGRTVDSAEVESIHSGPIHKPKRGRSANQNRFKSIAIHYSGDTSKYTNGNNENYEGNGRLRHAGGTYTDWEASPWVNILSMDRFFKLDRGVVTIQENGLYNVYAQIFYHDAHDTNGFVVQHNAQSFLQCTTMTHSHQPVIKSNTCFTSGVVYLRNGDTIQLNDLGNHRYTLFEPAKSFFGIIKIGDARPLFETLA